MKRFKLQHVVAMPVRFERPRAGDCGAVDRIL